MRPSRHVALSLAAGGVIWATTGEPLALPIVVGAGVLVDIDHAPDYFWTLALRRRPIATFVLHSWEGLLGLFILGAWIGFDWWLLAIQVGYGLHVTSDHMFNRGGPFAYFLSYRALHRFQLKKISPSWDYESSLSMLQDEMPIAAWVIRWWVRRNPPNARTIHLERDNRAASGSLTEGETVDPL